MPIPPLLKTRMEDRVPLPPAGTLREVAWAHHANAAALRRWMRKVGLATRRGRPTALARQIGWAASAKTWRLPVVSELLEQHGIPRLTRQDAHARKVAVAFVRAVAKADQTWTASPERERMDALFEAITNLHADLPHVQDPAFDDLVLRLGVWWVRLGVQESFVEQLVQTMARGNRAASGLPAPVEGAGAVLWGRVREALMREGLRDVQPPPSVPAPRL